MEDIIDGEEAVLKAEDVRLWKHKATLMIRELSRYCFIYNAEKTVTRERKEKLLHHVEQLRDGKKLKRFCDRLRRWYALHGLQMPLPETLRKLDEPEELW